MSTSMGKFAVSHSRESHRDQVFASCIRLDNVGGAECVSGNCLKERNQPWEYEVQNYPWVKLLPLPKTSCIIWSKVLQQFFHILYSGVRLCNYLSHTFSMMWTELYGTGISSHSMKRTSLVPLRTLREFLLFRILQVSLLFCSGSWDLVLLRACLEVPQSHGVTHLHS